MLRTLGRLKCKHKNITNLRSYSISKYKCNENALFEKLPVEKPHLIQIIGSNQHFSKKATIIYKETDQATFEKVCEETLESLTDFFEELVETNDVLKSGDISYSGGVLTVNLGKYGTYVINRQAPNKQIWLSSPKSGPKRYDFVEDGGFWIYKHDHNTLHELLQIELSNILGKNVDITKCVHCKILN